MTKNLKHRAILITIYGAGLRISEAANLRVSDIDSNRMQLRIRDGKGNKDRYTLLSQTNLKILREYWTEFRPKEYLFPGVDKNRQISARTIQKVFGQVIKKAGISKDATVHTLRHYVEQHTF